MRAKFEVHPKEQFWNRFHVIHSSLGARARETVFPGSRVDLGPEWPVRGLSQWVWTLLGFPWPL